jgi:hypothetical protein
METYQPTKHTPAPSPPVEHLELVCIVFAIPSSFDLTQWNGTAASLAMRQAISLILKVNIEYVAFGYTATLCPTPAPTSPPSSSPSLSPSLAPSLAPTSPPSSLPSLPPSSTPSPHSEIEPEEPEKSLPTTKPRGPRELEYVSLPSVQGNKGNHGYEYRMGEETAGGDVLVGEESWSAKTAAAMHSFTSSVSSSFSRSASNANTRLTVDQPAPSAFAFSILTPVQG